MVDYDKFKYWLKNHPWVKEEDKAKILKVYKKKLKVYEDKKSGKKNGMSKLPNRTRSTAKKGEV